MTTLFEFLYSILEQFVTFSTNLVSFFETSLSMVWNGLSFLITFLGNCPGFLAGFIGFGAFLVFANVVLKII